VVILAERESNPAVVAVSITPEGWPDTAWVRLRSD